MKKFSDIKQGDTVYFLIDTCGILNGNHSIGFANSNYGLIICSRVVTSESWYWHNPRKEDGTLFELAIGEPIMKGDMNLFGPTKNGNVLLTITKKDGRESYIKTNFGSSYRYGVTYPGYVFTTKEALEKKIREVTEIVEANLKKINEALCEI
jgi:hypothetical protein